MKTFRDSAGTRWTVTAYTGVWYHLTSETGTVARVTDATLTRLDAC